MAKIGAGGGREGSKLTQKYPFNDSFHLTCNGDYFYLMLQFVTVGKESDSFEKRENSFV